MRTNEELFEMMHETNDRLLDVIKSCEIKIDVLEKKNECLTRLSADLLAQEKELKDCLELLVDNQNGCPLEKYREQWEEAMARAAKLLNRTGGAE